MGVEITVRYLGDPDAEQELRDGIRKLFEQKTDDWKVSVLGDQRNTIWELKIDGPKGKRWLKKFDEAEGHSVKGILEEIRSMIDRES